MNKTKINLWIGMGVLLFLAGCYSVSYIPYDLKTPTRVAKNPADVVIISDNEKTKLTKPYKEIGIVEASSEYGDSLQTLMEALRKKAAEIGADAIVNLQQSSGNKTTWTNYYYLILPENKEVLRVKGTAIIFLEEKQQ